ncbi:MAG: hypothetical protein ACREEM_56615, partial [Blastocatellia bacterium]
MRRLWRRFGSPLGRWVFTSDQALESLFVSARGSIFNSTRDRWKDYQSGTRATALQNGVMRNACGLEIKLQPELNDARIGGGQDLAEA